MINRAQEVLKQTFGFLQFRGHQQQVIESVIEGKDCLVLMPTGGGKSLCYQVPALVLDGMTIVVSPLIALMQDQVMALQQLGVRAAYLNSTLSAEQASSVMRSIHEGELDLLYIAPERLLQENTLMRLTQKNVSLIAIDEAHCVSQWGHDFRVDYLGLHVLKQAFPAVPRIALTATADQRTRNEMMQRLALNEPEVFVSSFDRPNIKYTVRVKTDVKSQLSEFLKSYHGQSGIVYCMSRNRVEGMAAWLQSNGFNALPYHAGMTSHERQQNQQRFQREDAIIMVATVAFGMGIDKPNVRFVAHLDLPKNIEAYYQETGRAGRDGQPSEAWMVYGLQDVMRVVKMVNESAANEEIKRIDRAKIDTLLAWCETVNCRRIALLDYFGETYPKNCGNCDICLNPPKTWDATEAAQKLLSNIYRTGQSFGSGHLIDVIRGKDTAKVRQFGHNKLSTYGIGAEIGDKQWRSIIRQLIVQGFILVNENRYGALQLTEAARDLLRGDLKLNLREESELKKQRRVRATPAPDAIQPHDQELWQALKACRKNIADELEIPPFHVFHDSTLQEMLLLRPKTINDLLQINGIGEVKQQKYGQQFLNVMAKYLD